MTNENNIMLLMDGYKPSQWKQRVNGIGNTVAYFEARNGAEYPYTVFYGLQILLEKHLVGRVVTLELIEEAKAFYASYFGDSGVFNEAGWRYILEEHNGYLPIRIKAVQEGLKIPNSNVLMVVESTDCKCGWLVGELETLLTHVWYGSTVATKSRFTREIIERVAAKTGDTFLDFHVHDFGFRGVTCVDAAGVGGSAHLLNFNGTDTLQGMLCAQKYYGADLTKIGKSIPASEHSVMSSMGEEGEEAMMLRVIQSQPTGFVAFPIDSFDAVRMMETYVKQNKQIILDRYEYGQKQGILSRVVCRPDSPRFDGDTAAAQVLWMHEILGEIFGFTLNEKGFKVLHPAVSNIYGDGLSTKQIDEIYESLYSNGWSISNSIVGQGGGLLQKISRDTQRFAFKCCAQEVNGKWIPVQKNPLDKSKASKAGRMKLVKELQLDGTIQYKTYTEKHPLFWDFKDELVTVFENGKILKRYSFEEVQANTKL